MFVTWGAINWLPDIQRWAKIVARFLKPGGALYLAEGHPAALVLDDMAPGHGDMPGWYAPYFLGGPLVIDNPCDYADPAARLRNARTYEWIHPLGEIVTALLAAGLTLRWLHEHDAVPWRMFELWSRATAACIAGPTGPGCRLPFRCAPNGPFER